MKSLIEAIGITLWNTPWWVYALLAYCIIVGIKAARGGVVPYFKVIIIPIVFAYLSLDSLFSHFSLNSFVLAVFCSSLVLGFLCGILQAYKQNIVADRSRLLIKIPGTWSTLIIILIIFFTKYYFGYETAVDPKLLENTHFEFAMLFVSGVTAGLFIGRFVYYTRRLFYGPSVELHDDES
ncbi:MAG TPA: hypothetical protein DCL40_02195 [Coxiellaceae bacterium]|nr:hypothetical protein [Coxiellaceae bacterium]|tara:strand:+ start:356 stop:895 length:540 start_codon:yes stop_codon:yes gene_type:complete